MRTDIGTPLYEKDGIVLHALYLKVVHETFMQWGYLVLAADQSYTAFRSKVSALQYIDQLLQGDTAPDAVEPIGQEDRQCSPTNAITLITPP